MKNDEFIENCRWRRITVGRSGFGIPFAFVIRASSLLVIALSIFPGRIRAADNLGVLGSKPKWDVLQHYQGTITRDEVAQLLNGVYCTHGIPNGLIKIDNDAPQIVTNRESSPDLVRRDSAARQISSD